MKFLKDVLKRCCLDERLLELLAGMPSFFAVKIRHPFSAVGFNPRNNGCEVHFILLFIVDQ